MLRQLRLPSLKTLVARAVRRTPVWIILISTALSAQASGVPPSNPLPVLNLYSSSLSGAPSVPTAASAQQPAPDDIGLPKEKDWSGIQRDTGIFFGTQIVAVGLIYMMPESVSSWSREQKRDSWKKYERNVGHPVMDHDQFYINYVLHPYWGATYYTRARERGLGKGESFAYSLLISTMYEFGVECFFEKPSIQDLIVTPIGGSLLGAYLFEPLRESIRHKQQTRSKWYYDALMVITDPVGVLSAGIEKALGIKTEVSLDYPITRQDQLGATGERASKGGRIGLKVKYVF